MKSHSDGARLSPTECRRPPGELGDWGGLGGVAGSEAKVVVGGWLGWSTWTHSELQLDEEDAYEDTEPMLDVRLGPRLQELVSLTALETLSVRRWPDMTSVDRAWDMGWDGQAVGHNSGLVGACRGRVARCVVGARFGGDVESNQERRRTHASSSK